MTESTFANFDMHLGKKLLGMLREGYPARLKRVYVVTPPLWFKAMYKLLAPLLKEKMKERVSWFITLLHGYKSVKVVVALKRGCVVMILKACRCTACQFHEIQGLRASQTAAITKTIMTTAQRECTLLVELLRAEYTHTYSTNRGRALLTFSFSFSSSGPVWPGL